MIKEFDIYVDDHILKWAQNQLWDADKPPYKISERSLLGTLILGLLNDKRGISVYPPIEAESVLRVELSDTLAKRSPDPLKLSRVNNILEKLFKAHLQTWVETYSSLNLPRHRAMIDFFNRYDIECSQRIIQRYQKYIQREKSRSYSNYLKNKFENSSEKETKREVA